MDLMGPVNIAQLTTTTLNACQKGDDQYEHQWPGYGCRRNG